MKNYLNSNITSLFGNYSNTAKMYGDYSLIKSGSYKKLLKAYYTKNTEGSKDTNASQSTSKKDKTVSTEFTKAKAEADSLKKAAEKLGSEDFWKTADTEKITGALKDFVKEYNDTVAAASKVNSKEVANNTQWMTSLSSTMTKSLNKIGLSVGIDSKLSLDEAALSKASTTSIKNLFNGEYSYGGQIANKAHSISTATVMNTSIYNNDASVNSALSSLFNIGI